LFYVSTPASVAGPIIEGLGAVGLNRRDHGWTRIVLEKPFGRDLESAHALNEVVRNVFDEKTVYRIDHYLGKETVQNILVFRFSNSLFEPVWNRNYIDYVEITAAETVGVENRAALPPERAAGHRRARRTTTFDCGLGMSPAPPPNLSCATASPSKSTPFQDRLLRP
jgi:glucose-6-phosphate 1-dehydrogenase